MTTQAKLIVAVVVLALIVVILAGLSLARGFRAAPAAQGPAPEARTSPAAAPSPATTGTSGEQVSTAAAVPDPDFGQLALDGYEAVCADKGDLLNDGNTEWVIGYQSTRRDDMGYPADPAYFELVQYDEAQGQWVEWFSIPSPGDENALDAHSLRSISKTPDGETLLELVFYGFGVSSRPEPVCFYKITADGAEEAMNPLPLPKTSDDALVTHDVLREYPGAERIFAQAVLGSEAHAAPHRYKITIYGWKGGLYRSVRSRTTSSGFVSGVDAIATTMSLDLG